MFRKAFLPLLAAASLAACGAGQDPTGAADALPLRPFEPNRASPPRSVLDVAAWSSASPGGVTALFVALGEAGLDVHRADGSHLQRLGRSPASRLATLEGVIVDDNEVTLLAAADAGPGGIAWFSVDEGSGALQRLPEASTEIHGGVAGLCAQRDPLAGTVHLVATTADGHLERWSVTARSERAKGRPHRIETTLERRVPLDVTLGDCAADPATGELIALGSSGELRRVSLPSDPASPAGTEALLQDSTSEWRDLALVEQAGQSLIVALEAAGSGVAILDASGRELGRVGLAQPAARISASRALMAVVPAGGADARLAPWPEVEKRLATGGRTP